MFSFLTKNIKKIKQLLELLEPLIDVRRTDLSADEFWQPGTYFSHPARQKALITTFYPAGDPVRAAREAAEILEARTGLVLDWAAGVQYTKSGLAKVVLVIKTYACCAKTGREREFRPGPDDLAAVAELERKGVRAQKKEREKGRFSRERER